MIAPYGAFVMPERNIRQGLRDWIVVDIECFLISKKLSPSRNRGALTFSGYGLVLAQRREDGNMFEGWLGVALVMLLFVWPVFDD